MRLLSLTLNGTYKGLKDKPFRFQDSEGNMIGLIGLNGSGKSQLLELIAECFAHLERYLRHDFKSKTWFDFSVDVAYSNQPYDSESSIKIYEVRIDERGAVFWKVEGNIIPDDELDKEQLLPSHIIGYSSGLNENLQRAFMKNTIQYLDAMNAKRSWETRLARIKKSWDEKDKTLSESDLTLYNLQIEKAYAYSRSRFPGIFPKPSGDFLITENPELGIRATPLPMLKYLDHDCTALLLTSLGLLEAEEQKSIFNNEQRFNHISTVTLKYDLRKFTYDAGAVLDIAKLVACIGGKESPYFTPLSTQSPDDFYNQFELDYLVGEISINFNDPVIKQAIASAFFEPVVLFEKLYRIQLLGAEFWPREIKQQLKQGNFEGNVKKPQKWLAPLQVQRLLLADEQESVIAFEDLSDGEAQLIQILTMAGVFKESRTLFLLDEPETHLNPSWRTYFHSYLDSVLNTPHHNPKVQLFVSTHSPFMVSSLRKENVFLFERNQHDLIDMKPVNGQTYGASFDVLIKEYFGLRSLISQSVIEEIREQLKQGDSHARQWIEENLGKSPEKAYLLKRLDQ